jgi:AraC-like DNA-binding protein
VQRVAEMVGFSSSEQLRRACKRFAQARPADLRHHLQHAKHGAGPGTTSAR